METAPQQQPTSPLKGWGRPKKKEKLHRSSSFLQRLRSKSGRDVGEKAQGSSRLSRKGSVVQILSRSFSMPNVKKTENVSSGKEDLQLKFLSPWRATCGKCEGSGVDFLGIKCSCVMEREVIKRSGETSLLRFLELGHPMDSGEHLTLGQTPTNNSLEQQSAQQSAHVRDEKCLQGRFSVSNIQAELCEGDI